MLSFITWKQFIEATSILTGLYYFVVIILYYRKEILALLSKKTNPYLINGLITGGMLLTISARAQTADGNNGINQANTLLRGYFDSGVQVMYAVGAVVGLIGAVKVYVRWSGGGDHDVPKLAAAWFGACIFLVVVATVIKSFFGL